MSLHKARVKETTTSTGDGLIITRDGAAAGFQAFDTAYLANEYCPYWLIGSDGSWERGWGYWSSGNNFSRAVVDESSNAGSRVVLPAGTHTLLVGSDPSRANNRGYLFYRNASHQSVPTSGIGSGTAVIFDAQKYSTDPDGFTLPRTANVLPDWVTKVRVTASVEFALSAAGTFREVYVAGDDSFGKDPGLPRYRCEPFADSSTIIQLSSGVVNRDYDEYLLFAVHNAGSNLDVRYGDNTWICVEYIE